MSAKKNYDRYNMTISSLKEDGEEEKSSIAERIFTRRKQAINQEGAVLEENGMSPAEVFRRRRENLKTVSKRTPKQTEGVQTSNGDVTFSKSPAQNQTPILSSYLTGNHEDNGMSYVPVMQDKTSREKIESSTRTAIARRKKEEQEREEAKRILGKVGFQDGYQFKRYADLSQEPDFEEWLHYGREKPNVFPNGKIYSPLDIMVKEQRDAMTARSKYNYMYMSDTEKDLYHYLNGKYGADAANNYLKSIGDDLNRRSTASYTQNAEEFAKIHPIAGTGVDAGMSLLTGVTYPMFLAEQAYKTSTGKDTTIDPNADAYFSPNNLNEALRSGIKQNEGLSRVIPNDNLRSFLTDTGLSMTENLSRLPLGGIGLIAAAGGAGLSGTKSAVERGGSSGNAVALGIANAGAEAFFEKFSLEGLQALKASPAKGVKEFIKNMGKQAITEGSEEGFTEIANAVSDQVIMDNLSQYNLEYEKYVNLGMDEKAAKEKAFQSFLSNVGLSIAGGALSGGIMGGGGQALGLAKRNHALNQYGKNIDQDYRDYSQNMDISSESYASQEDYQEAVNLQKLAEEYAERQKRGEFIKNREKAEYDLRFREFQNNMMDHNNIENEDISAQNEPQAQEKTESEEYQGKPLQEEYEPYSASDRAYQNTQDVEPVTEESMNPAEAYRRPYGENGGKALTDNYDGNVDISTYNKAFGRIYDAGRYDIDLSIAEHSALVALLTPEQVTAAYKAGVQDRNQEMQIDLKTGLPSNMVQREPKRGGLGNVTEYATEAQKTVAKHVGKMTGLKINLVDNMEQGNSMASYKPGEITVSVNASDFNGAMSHELTHFIKDYANDAYGVYSKYAVKSLMEADSVSYEDLIERYEAAYSQEGQELSRDEVIDEIVADATQRFFNDAKFAESVVTQDRTLAQKIVDFFTDVVDALKSLMKTGSTRKAAKALEEKIEYFEGCRNIWMNAAGEAGERYKSGAEIVNQEQKTDKKMLEKPDKVTTDQIEKNYEEVRKMEPVTELTGNEFPRGGKKISEQVLGFFDSIGGKVYNDIVGDILLDKRAIKDDMAHGVTDLKAIAFAAVPDVLRDGKILDHQVNWKGRGYDSATLGAKVKIGGKEYYELAVVKLRDKNRLYLHSVYTTKVGENAVLDQVFPSDTESTSGGHSLPINSIIKKLNDVNEVVAEKGVKYQLEDVDDATTQRKIEALLYENQTLKEANELLEKQFKITPKDAVRQQDVAKVSRGLLKEYNSSYKQETLAKNLDRLYGYIRSAEHVDNAELTEAATSIARSILKQSKQIDTELTQQYKDLRNQIRNTKINITDQDKADLASAGGYNEFRRRNFGRMKLGNDGISVDSLYQELSAQHPELFSEDVTHPADQLMAIADALDQTDSQVSNPYHANMDEMAYMVGQDILQSYFDVRQPQPTFADRKAAEVQKVRRDYSQKMREYKNSLKKQYENNLYQVRKENIQEIQKLANAYKNLTAVQQKEQKEYYKKKMDNLRNEKNQALAAMQQKNREQTKRMRENQRAREAKKIIIKEAKTMQAWLLKPTDAKHIPEEIRTVVAEFLSNIDFSSNELNNNGIPTQRTKAWMEAKDAFAKIIEQGGIQEGKDGSRIYMEIDPDLVGRIEAIAKKAEGVEKLDNLNVYHMEELKKAVLSMKKAITEANTLKSNKRSGQLSILAEGVFNDLKDRKNRPEYLGVIGPADRMLNYDMLDAQTMFGKLGDNFESLYKSLREGLDKKTIKLKDAQDHVEKLLKDNGISYRTLREWTGTEAKTTKYRTSGGTIELTISQVMSLYELNKRNQARTHMYERTGGIIPAPRAGKMRIEDGKLILPKTEKAYRETKVTEEDIARIINTLTPEQKALADGMQRFMGDDCAAWGNEVSMQMYGYMKYTARNYFPITVYDNHIHTEQGDLKNQQRTIKNLGFTKSTMEKANKPIVIEDIFDVYSRQVDQMSTYNAYVIPLSDLNKVFNYVDMRNAAEGISIKEEIERTYGKEGNKYIDKLIADINGSLNKNKNLWDKLSQNMKVASVAGNIRVALQQPTAYIRASMEIDAKYLARGALTMTRKDQWEIMCKYAPIAQWKDWGFYRMDNSRQIKDVLFQTDSKTQKVNNAFMIFAEKGDKLAWNRLWRACEFECMEKHPELSRGTEAFYTEVGKRFSEVIDKTQVVDSVLHRTQIMRSERDSDKMLTAFMAEPLKTYDMLYREATNVAMGKKGAKGRMAKAVTVYAAAAFVTSAAAAIQDAMRDDDRDKEWIEKYWDNLWGNFADNMNLINNIPYVKDAYGIFFDGYTPNRPDVAAYQDVARAIKRVKKLADGESNLTPQAVMLDVIQSSSKLFGSPVKSATRDMRALLDTAINEFGSESADYTWLKYKYAIGSKENLDLYVGMMIEAQRNGNKAFQEQIKTDLNKAGIDNETISSKIKVLIKGELVSNDTVDPRIDEAAKAKTEMDLDTYEAAINELMEEGYAGKLIGSAISTRMNQLSNEDDIDWEAEAEVEPDELYGEILTGKTEEEDDWNLYSSGDIIAAVEMIDRTPQSLETFNHIVSAMVKHKEKSGKKAEDAASSIKSSITRKYKEEWIAAYQSGNREAYEEIQRKLNYLKVNGKALYSGKDYMNWRKEATKS